MPEVKRGPGRPRKSSDSSETILIEDMDRSTDEDFIVDMVHFMLEEAGQARVKQEFDRMYKRGWDFYHGRQYIGAGLDDDRMTDDDYSQVNRDICFSTVRRLAPLVTDARPVRYVRADHPDQMIEEIAFRQEVGLLPTEGAPIKTDEEVAKDLTEMWHAQEERNGESYKLGIAITNVLCGGIAWRFPFWNRSYADDPGEGRVKDLRDSRDVLIDPECEEIDLSDARYILVKRSLDADIAQKRYRLSDNEIREIMRDQGHTPGLVGGVGFTAYRSGSTSADTRRRGDAARMRRPGMIRPRVDVIQCWFQGDLPLEFVNEGPSPKQRNVRYRVFTIAGNRLIRTPEPNPYEHGRFPGVPFRDNPDSTSPYGFPELKWLIDDQITINTLMNEALLTMASMGTPRMVAEEGALVNTPTNAPGEVLRVRRGGINAVRWQEGLNFPPSLLNLLGAVESHSQQRSNETIQGIAPGAQSSGISISNLQEMALSVVREKARWLEWSYTLQGYLEVSNIQQFGSQRMAEEYLSNRQMDLGEFENWSDRIRNLTYDITVESKAELPMNLMDRLRYALQLRQTGLYDNLSTLDFADIPIPARLRENMELADQMEREAAEFQLEQLQAARGAFQQQQAGGSPMVPGMGGGTTPGPQGPQRAPQMRAPQIPSTQEQAAVGVPAQSRVASQ